MNRLYRCVVAAALSVGLFLCTEARAAAPAAARKPALLIQMQPDATFAKELEAAGFVWDSGQGWNTSYTNWSRDYLKQFNAIVFVCYPQVGTAGPTEWQSRLIELLRWYVEEGGGLFICGGSNQDSGMCVRFQNELLKPYGVEVLREYICDKENQVKGRFWTYAWTDRIEKDALTEGVNGLFYPMVQGWGGTSAANPLKAGDGWKLLVRGMPSAYTCALYDSKPTEDKPAGYATLPPLVAVRDAGKGRIVLWPTLATTTFIDGYHYMWDDGLILSGKLGEHSSQGSVLAKNLLKYLVEPSMRAGGVGGYVPKPRPPRDLLQEPGFKPFDWDKEKVADGIPTVCKVLIGARTALSSGQGTVAEYAVEAAKHGYATLVITEDLEKMDADKWSKLVQDCRKASTTNLCVVEGLKFMDENGNQGVVFGSIGWPKTDWMSTNAPGRIKEISFWTHGYDFWPPVAVITPKLNPKRPWFLGTCKGYAAYTYQNGRLVDESVDEYLQMQQLRFNGFVLAVHLMDSPAQVANAAMAGNFQTYVRADRPGNVAHMLSGTYSPHNDDWYFPAFVSSGPMVETFQTLNFGTADLSVPGNERHRLRVAVSSTEPLTEVRIMDGRKLFRRFSVNGSKTFDRSLDLFHDRQRSYVAIVTDAKGRQAVSWQRWVEVQEQWFGNCGDNWNIMYGGKWSGTRFMTCRAYETYISPASADWIWPRIQVQNGDKTSDLMPGRPAVHVNEVMVSRFASVVDYIIEDAYAPEASANWNDFCETVGMKPLESLRSRVRCTFFTSRPDQPEIRVIEGKVTLKTGCKLAAGNPVTVEGVFSGQNQPYDHLSYSDASGMNIVEKRPQVMKGEVARRGALAKGGYVAVWPYVGGAVGMFALDDLMQYYAWFQGASTSFRIMTGSGGREYRPGETLDYRLMIVQDRKFPSEESNRSFEWIKSSLGLQGEPAYAVTPATGKVLSRMYVLRVKAEDGGFSGRFTKAALPEDLPVMVEGLNGNWQAGVWYKGKNVMLRPEWRLNDYDQLIAVMVEREIEGAFYPGPVEEGTGYFGVDIEKSDRDVFLGNFLVCDAPDVVLQILDARAGKRRIEVHNPKDKPVTCTVRPARGFGLLGAFRKKVTVPAGESAIVDIEAPPQK